MNSRFITKSYDDDDLYYMGIDAINCELNVNLLLVSIPVTFKIV